MKTRNFIIMASIFAVLIVLTPPVFAQQQQNWLSYSAKFVCGRADLAGETIVGGRYRTAVNIHNPHYLTNPVGGMPAPLTFFKKAVLAKPQGERPSPPSCFQQEFLLADGSVAVTCRNIRDLLIGSGITVGRPFEGYLVVLVPPFQDVNTPVAPEIDVTAVYTASQELQDNGVQAIDVEDVKPKNVIGQPQINPCNGHGVPRTKKEGQP